MASETGHPKWRSFSPFSDSSLFSSVSAWWLSPAFCLKIGWFHLLDFAAAQLTIHPSENHPRLKQQLHSAFVLISLVTQLLGLAIFVLHKKYTHIFQTIKLYTFTQLKSCAAWNLSWCPLMGDFLKGHSASSLDLILVLNTGNMFSD